MKHLRTKRNNFPQFTIHKIKRKKEKRTETENKNETVRRN